MKKTKEPLVLTVNGKAELVVQDAESWQKLSEAKDSMEAIEGIKRGLESIETWPGQASRSSLKSSSPLSAFLHTNETLPRHF